MGTCRIVVRWRKTKRVMSGKKAPMTHDQEEATELCSSSRRRNTGSGRGERHFPLPSERRLYSPISLSLSLSSSAVRARRVGRVGLAVRARPTPASSGPQTPSRNRPVHSTIDHHLCTTPHHSTVQYALLADDEASSSACVESQAYVPMQKPPSLSRRR